MDKKGVGVDDFFPLMLTMFVFIIVITVVLVASGDRENKIAGDIQSVKTNLDFIKTVNYFLNKEVECVGKKARVIDFMAVANEDEDEKIDCLRTKVEDHFDNYRAWGFKLEIKEDKIFSTGAPLVTEGNIKCIDKIEYIINLSWAKIVFWCM